MDERDRITDSELITEKEAAHRIGVNRHTMRYWRIHKGIPHFKFGRKVRYSWPALTAWARSQALQPGRRANGRT